MSKVILRKTYSPLEYPDSQTMWEAVQTDAKKTLSQFPPGKRFKADIGSTTFKNGNTYATLTITDTEAVNWPNMIWFLICLAILVILFVGAL